MRTRRRRRAKPSSSRATARRVLVGLGLGLAACSAEAPPPLSVNAPEADTDAVPEPEPSDEASDARDLWFAEGPGREAIVALGRDDVGAAQSALDVLRTRELSADDRAALALLDARVAARQERWADAAARYAEARAANVFAPVADRLAVLEAKARLKAGEPEVTASLLGSSAVGARPDPGLRLLRAQALARTGRNEEAREAFEKAIADEPEAIDRLTAHVDLGELLAESEDRSLRSKAIAHFEKVQLQSPLSDLGERASEGLAALKKEGVLVRGAKAGRDFDRQLRLARAQAQLKARKYTAAVETSEKFLADAKRIDASAKDRCTALFIQGSAIFKQRKRADARPTFDKAAKQCAKAGDTDREVKARYQGARGRYAEQSYAAAAKAFEKLAVDHHGHSYADDAWILAGESWEMAGQADKARAAFRAAFERHPEGDMNGEARRRLVLMAFAERKPERALKTLDAALARGKVYGDDKAKLHYLRGRALAQMGRLDEARAAYLEAVRLRPLAYPGLQALSRLREFGDEALSEGLALLERAGDMAPPLELPPGAASERARLWARLGFGAEARRELMASDTKGWPAVATLADAGLYTDAQRAIANLGSNWRDQGPVNGHDRLWHLAHPRPFADVIEGGEQSHATPHFLTFAIMQTESLFNPRATSWAGARGLVQLMPKTAEGLARDAGVEAPPERLYDPNLNLDLGMRYLAKLTNRFGGNDAAVALAIPSYNAGAGNVDKWLAQRGEWDLDLFIEAIPFDETRRYTQKVLGRWWAYRYLYGEGDAATRLPELPLQTPKRAG